MVGFKLIKKAFCAQMGSPLTPPDTAASLWFLPLTRAVPTEQRQLGTTAPRALTRSGHRIISPIHPRHNERLQDTPGTAPTQQENPAQSQEGSRIQEGSSSKWPPSDNPAGLTRGDAILADNRAPGETKARDHQPPEAVFDCSQRFLMYLPPQA